MPGSQDLQLVTRPKPVPQAPQFRGLSLPANHPHPSGPSLDRNTRMESGWRIGYVGCRGWERDSDMHAEIADRKGRIAGICRRHRVSRLEVFGSAARGTDFDPERAMWTSWWSSSRRPCRGSSGGAWVWSGTSGQLWTGRWT